MWNYASTSWTTMSSDYARVAELLSLVSADLTPYYDTHFNLLRWIQAYPGESMEKIAQRLRHHLRFRACTWDIDSIHARERDHPIHKYWPITFAGMSGRNCLVLYEQSGLVDYEGIHEHFSVPEIVKAKIFDAEEVLHKVMEIEKETGEQATSMLVIDAEGVQYSKKLVELMLGPMNSRSEFMLTHYVELVDKVVVVNFPSWAHPLWLLVKPLLPKRSREKVHIFSSSNWREEISSVMDQSSCTVQWDKMRLDRPPRVPRLEITEPLDTLDKVHVKAGRVHWMDFCLEKGDELEFHLTGDSSFGVSIILAENKDDEDVSTMCTIYPLFNWIHGPFKVPLADKIVAPVSGTYKLWLSNSRAWWSSVGIRYNVKVTKNELDEY
ncbi:hypothetical protein PMAYCL1PPCAC_15504 [Pristionchus mayeri]|uniref:CRAL-TRIO domain-containing protein n=1 Tax=Pristionchus mayeri TaxID=1317129 RepID=A0AAN5CJ12_9BILA|nr:hypothetical protein PMAYCL1PPCAC_15504 [Pristionchus mayeri]